MAKYITLRSGQKIEGELTFHDAFKQADYMQRMDLLNDWIAQLKSIRNDEYNIGQGRIPYVRGVRVPGREIGKVQCPYCHEEHNHGWGDGLRTAHCDEPGMEPNSYHIMCDEE